MIGNGLDRWSLGIGASPTRRAFGAAVALAALSGGLRIDARKKKKKKKKKPACAAEPRVTTCTETCGGVTNNCGQTIDCGACEGFVFEREWGLFGSGNGQFVNPKGIAVDARGNVYVADSSNDRIQKFDNDGGYLTKWGGTGSTDGKLNDPRGVAVDADGHVHVADTFNHRIQKFSNTGAYLTQWNSDGSAETVFENPDVVATDAAGNVYVSTLTEDGDLRGIRKFTSNGVFVARIDDNPTTYKVYDGLAIANGIIYASYYVPGGDRIEMLSGSGELLGSIGTAGTGEGQLSAPTGLALDGDGNLYVADTDNHRVQIFDPSGTFVAAIGAYGSGEGQFIRPSGVAVDGDGNLFVVDELNERIQKFRPAGASRRAAESKHQGTRGKRRDRGGRGASTR